ncbi:Scn1a [Symbiodinium natans]|uniref:Scn1a protein n=1 Tax=Symbiodinium natans TaxID=878477 RepID=A0A812URX0_9DINO|nr:Scn1a [Symbiodinium natans]
MKMMLLGELNPDPAARVIGFKVRRESRSYQVASRSQFAKAEPFFCSRFDEELEAELMWRTIDQQLLARLLVEVVLSKRRSIDDQLLSQAEAFGNFDYFATEQANKAMDSFARHHGSRVFSLDLEDFDVEHFNSLLHFLGEDDKCQYLDVVHDNDSPESVEFLATMSGQLQNVQHVIDDVTTQIAKLQQQINSKLGQVGPVVALPLTTREATPTDLDTMTVQYAQGAGTRVLEPVSEPTPEPEDEKGPEQEPSQMEKKMTDAEKAALDELIQQFQRCDVSTNGFVSGHELVALAFAHGEQLQLGSVLKLCTYLSSSARESVRPIILETISDEHLKTELDVNGFIALRGQEGLFQGAPADIVEAAAGLNRALDQENQIYKFDHDADIMRHRQRLNMARLIMDVGIVLVISLNALVIGISADQDPDSPFWEVLELVFFGMYLLECVVKLVFFDGWQYFVGSDRSWNIFDFACLVISAIELSISYITRLVEGGNAARGQLALLKVLRLARLARLVRVMRYKVFRELKLMALGLFSGLQALFWAIVLLMAVVFTMGIIVRSLFGYQAEKLPEFSSVDRAMFTLFRCFTGTCETYGGDPIPEKMFDEFEYGFPLFIGYFLIMMLVSVGLFNLIMAVFIDNVTKSQNQRKQKELGESAEMTEIALKMVLAKFINEPRAGEDSKDIMKRISEDAMKKLASLTDAGRSRNQQMQKRLANEAFKVLEECRINITREVFQAWLKDPEFVRVLEEADVDVSNKFELFNILDVDSGGELSVEELLNGLMGLRGDVSKGDVVSILLRVRDILQRVERMEQRMIRNL